MTADTAEKLDLENISIDSIKANKEDLIKARTASNAGIIYGLPQWL